MISGPCVLSESVMIDDGKWDKKDDVRLIVNVWYGRAYILQS